MPTLLHETGGAPDGWTVVCLCAAWCRTCDDYRSLLAARARREPAVRHLWLDIEDDAELLGDLEIETFPTVLVCHGGEPRLFAPLLPHIDALDQALARLRAGMAPQLPAAAGARADLARLAQALRAPDREPD